ncbi:MAG: transposase [Bdellovibrionales bacterium]|nr:transposase [Bdellovibrionales bacterium]
MSKISLYQGKKALVLKALPDGDHNSTSGLVAKNSGFSLHAGVATKAQEREKLEKICRYIARPALSEERLSTNVRGEIIYRLKKPWSDGTLAVKFTPHGVYGAPRCPHSTTQNPSDKISRSLSPPLQI